MPPPDRLLLEPVQLGGDPPVGALLDQIDRHADRIGEAERIGAAVALDHNAVQAEEHRAVVAPRIEPLAEQLERRLART